MGTSDSGTRGRRTGITLLPAMLAFLSIASILAVIQARELSLMRVQSRLITAQREAMDRRALAALLTADLARAMVAETKARPLDGTPFTVSFDNRTWTAQFQDVEGLVDLYLAPPGLFAAAGLNQNHAAQTRARLQQTMPLGRLPSLTQSLAAFDVPPESAPLFTQSARNGNLRVATAPQALKSAAMAQPPAQQNTGQTVTARVTLTPVQ